MSKHDTICWNCKKASGRCSWSREFKPVEGWRAIPTKVREQGKKDKFIPSYDVYECPEFDLLDKLKGEKNGVQG